VGRKVQSPIDGIVDALAVAVISRMDLHALFAVQLTEMARNLESSMRDMATEVFDEKISEVINEDSSAMSSAILRKVAEDVFESKIDAALENYDCSDAIEEALSNKDIESEVQEKVDQALDDVDWSDRLRDLRFKLV
jgi:hypothetical protein